MPSRAEYWHIGETTVRLRSVTLRSVIGENRIDFVTRCRPQGVGTHGVDGASLDDPRGFLRISVNASSGRTRR